MSEGAGQQASGLLMAVGWELHCTTGGSDKFYRVVRAGNTVIINWGRTGAAGGFKVHRTASPAAAVALADELTAQKKGRDYRLVREPVDFPVAASVPELANSGGGTQEHTEVAQDLVAMFLQVASYDERRR
jgi:predicted DNA-binding WGR domain protein